MSIKKSYTFRTNSKKSKLYLMLITFGMAGIFQGCLDDLVPGGDQLTVEAVVVVNPSEAEGGDQVTVDGSGSSASEDVSLQYVWTLNTPEGSSAELDDPDAEITTFTADVSGDYEVQLEVTADNISDTDQATVMVTSGIQELSGTISEDMTLFSDVLYQVVDDLTVNSGATLTIEPGTLIRFESETGLEVTSDAVISAIGTAEDSITFTGSQEEPGWWDGLFIKDTTHPDNKLEYVVVEYGGRNAFHSSVPKSNLVIGRSLYDAGISVNNSEFRNSGGLGLFIHSNGEMPASGNNRYTANSEGAVGVYTNTLHYLDDQSIYTANSSGNNFVYVEGNTLDEDATWQALDVTYAMHGNSNVTDAELTINSGAEFAFDAQTGITFGSGSVIRAMGTDENPITFTGLVEDAGWWNGIFVSQTTHPDNLIEYVTIEYAGGEEFHSSTEPANLTVGRSLYDASVTLRNNTFQNSENVGVFVHSNGDFPNSASNVYTNNNDGPISVSTDKIHFLDSGSSFSGNGTDADYAWVRGNTVEEDVTWQPLDVPYGMMGESQAQDAEVTIEPGAEFAFDAQASLEFGSGTIVNVIGTEQEPIVFTGTSETAGWWDGIHVTQTTHPNNTMDYVVIEYGGGNEHHSSVEAANLVVGRSLYESYLSISNSLIENSGDVGLYVNSNAETNSDVCTSNEFNNNTGSDCLIE